MWLMGENCYTDYHHFNSFSVDCLNRSLHIAICGKQLLILSLYLYVVVTLLTLVMPK